MLTAISNDYGFPRIFFCQLETNDRQGDVFIGLSTSGNSRNIIRTLVTCKEMGIIAVGLIGRYGGQMRRYFQHCLMAPSDSTPRIQKVHTVIGHAICATIEKQ